MNTRLRPEIKRAFKGVPATLKAQGVAQRLVDRGVEGMVEEVRKAKREALETVPDAERLAQYNAGYARAVADLFGVKDGSGMQVFEVDGRAVRPGPDGRLALEAER